MTAITRKNKIETWIDQASTTYKLDRASKDLMELLIEDTIKEIITKAEQNAKDKGYRYYYLRPALIKKTAREVLTIQNTYTAMDHIGLMEVKENRENNPDKFLQPEIEVT